MLRIFRTFFGDYEPNYAKLENMGYVIVRLPKPIISVLNSDQGFGKIEGSTKKLSANYPSVPVCCFKRSTRELLWETLSKPDGTYFFRNIAVGLECFVVAFDPNGQYNAVISDKLVAK